MESPTGPGTRFDELSKAVQALNFAHEWLAKASAHVNSSGRAPVVGEYIKGATANCGAALECCRGDLHAEYEALHGPDAESPF